MLTLLNRVYVFAIKNTGQYTTEEKLKQMWVLEPQAFEFAQKCYFKHSICWSTVFFFFLGGGDNEFLASLNRFQCVTRLSRKKKKQRANIINLWVLGQTLPCVIKKHKSSS